jgi:hypothetical protein
VELDTTRPFTRAQAHQAGLTDGQLRGPGFVQVLRGVYLTSGVTVDSRSRARAALLAHRDGAVLVGSTAAALLAVPVPALPTVQVGVLSDAERRPRPGVSSVVDRRRTELASVDGLSVTSGATLFLQLAAELSLVDLVVAGDAMVRRRMVTLDVLREACRCARGKGVRLARRAAALVRDRVDSPMETRVRLLLVFAGFPEPLVNPTIDRRYRADLCWAALQLVVEYDGRQHRDDLDRWDHDIERNEWFEQHDWLLIHVVARDVFQRPDEFLERVLDAWLRRGGARFRRQDEWRAHFPVRSDDKYAG